MATKGAYWEGSVLARVTEDDIEAEGIRDNTLSLAFTVRSMNEAFRIFYDARRLIAAVSDWTSKRTMTEELEGAARTGWGPLGVDDLEEAFGHLASNDGKWRDDDGTGLAATRFGGVGREIGVTIVVPDSIANFYAALESRRDTLKDQLKQVNDGASLAIRSVETPLADRALPEVNSHAWRQMSSGLKQVNRAHVAVQGLLWLAAVDEHSVAQLTSGRVGSILSAIGKVRSAVANLDSAYTAGYGAAGSVGFAALHEGLGALPVLGSYYQKAFGLLPGVTVGMTRIVQKRDALAAQLGVDLRTRREY